MKLIRAAWSIVLNSLLVLLPWFIVALFIIQFGQPILDQFKRFLGNPVMELQQVSEEVRDNPSEPIPYNRFRQQFQRLAVRDVISDTEKQQLRHTTLNIYKAVTHRVSVRTSKTRADNTSDTFFQLLETPLIPKIFDRPELIRQSLQRDLDRLEVAQEFPFHPARGLDQFLNHSDTAQQLVQSYGEIYADQLTCRRIAGTECQAMFGNSVNVVSEQLSQYLSNWPTPHNSLPSKPGVLLNYLPGITHTHNTLGDRLSGYLETAPWRNQHAFRAARNQFLDKLSGDLKTWYLNIINQVQTAPEQFTDETPAQLLKELRDLTELEQTIARSEQASNMIEGEQVLSARRQLLQQLTDTYHWVTASDQFNDEFTPAEQGIQQLSNLISELPGGDAELEDQRQLVASMADTHAQLVDDFEQRNYGPLAGQLNSLAERAGQSESELGWSIILRQFALATFRRVSQPDWQPLDQSTEEAYAEVVRAYGRIGRELQIREINANWVEQTILAMKSRRFNQLKHDVQSHLDNLDEDNVAGLIADLRDLDQLEDLPEELTEQPDLIIYHSALIERIKRSSDRVHQAFSSKFQSNSIQQARWEQLNTLLQAQESVSTQQLLTRLELGPYVNEIHSWLDELPAGDPLSNRIRDSLTHRLEEFIEEQYRIVTRWITGSGNGAPQLDSLISMTNNLTSGYQRALEIDGYTAEISPERWVHLLQFRQRLERLRERSQSLTAGSLVSSNTAFNRYQTELSEYEYQPFPSDYNFETEIREINSLHKNIINRARSIQQKYSQDWLGGWGGRISGRNVLTPWESFLTQLIDQFESERAQEQLRTQLEATQNQLEEWSS